MLVRRHILGKTTTLKTLLQTESRSYCCDDKQQQQQYQESAPPRRRSNPLFAKLYHERQMRDMMRTDPTLATRFERMTPHEKEDFYATELGSHPNAGAGGTATFDDSNDDIFSRAEKMRATRQKSESSEDAEQERHQLDLRRERARQSAIERGFADRATRRLRRSFGHHELFVSSQVGRYTRIDVRGGNEIEKRNQKILQERQRKKQDMECDPKKRDGHIHSESRGLFFGK
eukprot:PhM_4_TR1431/c0_g1_i1/m.12503